MALLSLILPSGLFFSGCRSTCSRFYTYLFLSAFSSEGTVLKSLSPRRISVGTLIEQRTPCGASCTGFNATRISSTTNSTTPVVSPVRKTGSPTDSGARLDLQFDDADAGEIVRHLAHVHLAYGSRRSVSPAPLAGPGSHVIAAPESPVEDGPKPLFPLLRPFGVYVPSSIARNASS